MKPFTMGQRRGVAVIEDGWIHLVHVQDRYDPFDHYHPRGEAPGLHYEFASLDDQDEEAIKAFVGRYGLLGLELRKVKEMETEVIAAARRDTRRALALGSILGRAIEEEGFADAPTAHLVRIVEGLPEAERSNLLEEEMKAETIRNRLAQAAIVSLKAERSERLEDFREEVRWMRQALRIWRAHKDRDEAFLRGLMPQAAEGRPGAASTETPLERGEALLTALTSRKLLGRVWPDLEFKNGEAVQTWRTSDLLAAMYLMLSLDMAGSLPVRQCANAACHRFFSPSREKQVYCRKECAAAERLRRFRRKKREEAGRGRAGPPRERGDNGPSTVSQSGEAPKTRVTKGSPGECKPNANAKGGE